MLSVVISTTVPKQIVKVYGPSCLKYAITTVFMFYMEFRYHAHEMTTDVALFI